MTKLEALVAEDGAQDAAPASLTPSRGHIASSGQSAAAASAVGDMRHRKAGHTVRTQDKVLLDAAIEVEKTRRLAPGDPGAATIVGRNIDTDALLKESLANTPGLERALALAQELDAQLSGISADQELGLATARVAQERYGPEPTEPEATEQESTEQEPEDVEIDIDLSPEVPSPEPSDADILPTVAGASPEGPATKRRLGALAGISLAAAIVVALLLTGKCTADSPDTTLAATEGAESSAAAAADPAANQPAPLTTSPERKAAAAGSGVPAASASALPEPSQSPSASSTPSSKPVRPPRPYRRPPPPSKSSPFIIHPGGQK